MTSNIKSNFKELTTILNNEFQGKINLARVKLIVHFICALCKVQTVTFEKLAIAFDTKARPESSLRRIQRFIASYNLSDTLIARLIFNLLPNKQNLTLSIDRTTWTFGQTDVNIFMLGIVYKGVAFPLLFSMLPKKGNTNSQQRIDLVNRFIQLFGKECIDCLVADREFVGEEWIRFLNGNQIKYHIRIRNNFKVYNPRTNKTCKAFRMFSDLKSGQYKHHPKRVMVNNQWCYISGCKLDNGEFLIIISFSDPNQAQDKYKERWQIEMCFKAMKSSGFDIEKTHLTDLERIKKLILLVMVAFIWCYKVGIYIHENIKQIKTKSHGRKAKSIFKHGLSYIASRLLNTECEDDINISLFLSCT